MALKYGFGAAVVLALALLAFGQTGLLGDVDGVLRIALALLILVAVGGTWFVDQLERRLRGLRQAVGKLGAGDDSIRLGAAARGAPPSLIAPFEDMAGAVNRRLEEMRAVVAQQRVMAEHGPDAMWVYDVDAASFVDANENFARLTGQPRLKLIGLNLERIAPAEQQGRATADYVRDLVQRALAGERIEARWTVRRDDATEVPCELRAIHIPTPGRRLICGLLLDISERVRTQAELDRRMRFESLVSRISSGFVRQPIEEADAAISDALGEVGRHAQVDRACLYVYDADRGDARCTHEWCAPGIAPRLAERQHCVAADATGPLAPLCEERTVSIDDTALLDPAARAVVATRLGSEVRAALLLPLRDESGNVGYASFERVQAAAPWTAQHINLLQLFGEMAGNLQARKRAQQTLQTQNETLAVSNAELTRSNQELQQFAYVASHDLQEPLRSIGSFSGLMARRYKGKLDARADEYLDFLTAASTRMQKMIVELLDYSRVGQEPRPFQPVSLDAPLDAALAALRGTVEELGAQIRHDPLPTVLGDAGQIAQLFQNLLGNALKFHSEQPPQVQVSAGRDNGHWTVSVRDNGIGIDPDRLEDVFQLFRRLHTQDQYPGTGIGLAICRRIVERHRGRIWAECNADGPGVTFRFTLPVPVAATTGDASAQPSLTT